MQEICRVRAEQKEINFEYEALSRLPRAVRAEEKRLRQVLINLIGNAIKFTDKGTVTFKVGIYQPSPPTIENPPSSPASPAPPLPLSPFSLHRVRFQVEDTGIGIEVEIGDTGSGIPIEIQEKIFEPFFTTKPLGEGSGLGLSIVRQIVERHRGKIDFCSEPGHTEFSVWLPANDKGYAN